MPRAQKLVIKKTRTPTEEAAPMCPLLLANFMYIEAFNNYRMGYGAAIAVILFLISLVFIGFYLSRVVKEEMEY